MRERLRHDGLDALLVTDPVDIRYLTGFTGSNAALWVAAADDAATVLSTDSRYEIQARDEAPEVSLRIERAGDLGLLEGAGVLRIGFDEDSVILATYHRWTETVAAGAELVPCTSLVAELREIKDPSEVAALRTACHIADAAFAGLVADGGIRAGFTERDIALDLNERMRRLDSEDISFSTILAAGDNSAIPHHQPTCRQLRVGELVKIDFGAVVDGYHSDMTRTLVLGEPADWQRELHALVAVAQQAGRDAAQPGASAAAIDAAARGPIIDAGYGDQFGHGLGHGVGLRVHEAPWLGPRSVGIMANDMTVTIEPGVYLPGSGGVRIEDCGVIGPAGYESLTLSSRDLMVL